MQCLKQKENNLAYSKDLEDLVDNIYESLAPLSENKPIELTDEVIDDTVEAIREALVHWARPSERNRNFAIRMSNVGRPARQLWYEKNLSNENTISASNQIRFLYGHILEAVLIMLVKLSGHTITDEQKEVEVEGIKGHIDCKIDGEVVDIKTASRISFNKFQAGKLPEDDPFGYIDQLSSYEEAEGTDDGGFLVINKETGELCFYQPGFVYKSHMPDKINNLKAQMELDSPPDLCYLPVPEGVKGNMKLARQCQYCNFKFECHKDSNEGKGLRAFKYARGPVYFTEVVSEPKVEEII